MNPKSLRAGKAVAETGQARLLPGFPKILFEDDQPAQRAEETTPRRAGVASAEPVSFEKQENELPEAYGTGKLMLTARDPHTLFAHWDFTADQQGNYKSLSADGSLALRAYSPNISNQPAVEVPIPSESRHVFVQVERAGTSYVGELGYFQPDGVWKTVATSGPTSTPPDSPSSETTAIFSTAQALRPGPTKHQHREKSLEAAQASVISATAVPWPLGIEASAEGEPRESDLRESYSDDAPPFVRRGPFKQWTSRQERLLAEMIRISLQRREWISSAEMYQLIERDVHQDWTPVSGAEMAWPILPGALVNISSPMGEQPGRQGFWFNVNAELIIYGATEPNAQVTIAGQPIQLRPDGTFSCHFALPDGDYTLVASAVSPECEQRQAAMNFSRHTDYSGDVGALPQNHLTQPK